MSLPVILVTVIGLGIMLWIWVGSFPQSDPVRVSGRHTGLAIVSAGWGFALCYVLCVMYPSFPEEGRAYLPSSCEQLPAPSPELIHVEDPGYYKLDPPPPGTAWAAYFEGGVPEAVHSDRYNTNGAKPHCVMFYLYDPNQIYRNSPPVAVPGPGQHQ